jgi:hypothetical protein
VNLLYTPPALPSTGWTTLLPLSTDADPQRWVEEQLEAAGARVRKLETRRLTTTRGWLLELSRYEADGLQLVIAYYEFIDLVAGIAIGGLEPAWWATQEVDVVAALRAVEPDWVSDEPPTLRALWST